MLSVDWPNSNLVVETLAVDPEHRRAGVGSALMAGAEAIASALGLARVVVECSPRNEGGLAFYRNCGYRQVSAVFQKDLSNPE